MARRKPGTPSGVLVIDKPRGPTSHDVVQWVRRVLSTREVGHAGTLDPMASGVLVVAVGEGTKLVPWLTAADKSYEATLALGVLTDSLDAEGRVTEERAPPENWAANLAAAIDAERAREAQIPPAFSAIKQDGVRSHERARRGEDVELEARTVRVVSLEAKIASLDPPSVDLSLTVAKGYYVRSLARDLAVTLGTVGHLTMLRRTRSGSFTLDDAVALGARDPRDASFAEDLRAHLLPCATAASRALGAAKLTERGVADAGQGRPVAREDIAADGAGVLAWLDERGTLVAIGEVSEDGAGRVLRGFTSSSSP